MKIVQINTVAHGSTGKIMLQISKVAVDNGHESYVCFPNGRHNKAGSIENAIYIGGRFSEDLHIILGRLTGLQGSFSLSATRRFLKKLDEIQPDIIHLHNLHNCYINLKMLFDYIKKNNIRTVWTLHDCWSFTGKCPHFVGVSCEKWKTGCYACPQYRSYPQAYVDMTKKLYAQKKKWFTGVADMTIVTPSNWLASLVKESFLKDYPVKVINNGINLDIFKPTESSFRHDYGLENKKIVLGVAFGWGVKKGLDVFCELSRMLPDNYQIVLVGTSENVDKELPKNIISIHRTSNQVELAKIYTSANAFVNPTREDTFPTVNMESLACGTPVVTFKTGGSPEIIDNSCGIVVEKNDIEGLKRAILKICEEKPFSKESCIERAKKFDEKIKFKEYIDLYSM